MEFVERNGISYFHSPMLTDAGIFHGFTTRKMTGIENTAFTSKPEAIQNSPLFEFAKRLEIDDHHFVLQEQVHGDQITNINKENISDGSFTRISSNDGLITKEKNICLITLSADCMSLLLADPESKTIANAHVGRRGAIQDLPAKLVFTFCVQMGIPPDRVFAVLGTSIAPMCYEVGEDVVTELSETNPTSLGFLITREKRRFFDLRGFVTNQLLTVGIDPEKIDSQKICSHCDEDLFYSYRRDGKVLGLMAAFIAT